MKFKDAVLFIGLISVFICSCSEDTNHLDINLDQNTKLVKSNFQNDEIIHLVEGYIELNDDKNFKIFSKIYGKPYIKESLVAQVSKGVMMIMPYSKRQNEVEGIFLFHIINENEINFNVIKRNQIKQFKKNSRDDAEKEIDQQLVLAAFIALDNTLFNYFDCKLIKAYEEILSEIKVKRLKNCITHINWEYTAVSTYDERTSTETIEWIITNYDISSFCVLDAGKAGNGNNLYDPALTLGPIDFDDNIISKLTDPCANELVTKLKNNSFGTEFNKILTDIFDISSDVNVEIYEQDLPSSTDGQFIVSQVNGLPGSTPFYYTGELYLNAEYLGKCTKDWLLATIVHEMIHGYIDYFNGQVRKGYMTKEELNRKFPLFTMDNSGHLTMGYQYVNTIAEFLKANNPALSDYEAKSLARVGLGETSFWNFALTQKERIDAYNSNEVGRGNTVDSSSNQIPC